MRKGYARYALVLIIVFAAYFLTAKFGLSLHPVSRFATFVWPPTGIALAAVLLFGYRLWPAIGLAAFLINLWTGASPLVALGIAIGNTIEPLIGAYLIKRFTKFKPTLDSISDVLEFILLAALISTAFSATIGVFSLWLGGLVPTAGFGETWSAWWVGDILGDLIFAPLILTWLKRPIPKFRFNKVLESFLLSIILIAASIAVFYGFPLLKIKPFTVSYIIFPLLIWIALRFGQRGSSAAIVIVSLTSVWSIIKRFSANSDANLIHNLLLLQVFMGITAVTFMVMAAANTERELNQSRQLKLLQRTEILKKQRAHLILLNKSKDEFISLASHQLKTPPTVIKQYIGMLLGNYLGKITKQQRGILEKVYDSNERQIKVIHELLNVAQMDTGSVVLNKANYDLVKLINDLLNDKSTLFSERKQTYNFNHAIKKCIAYIDNVKFAMAIENIIDNASKYTPIGKNITINLSIDKTRSVIAIQDEGVGITKKDMPKLFKKFSRIRHSTSVAVGGLGLGLYWSKKIISLHGGTIKVSSQPNLGSTFTVSIPITGKN